MSSVERLRIQTSHLKTIIHSSLCASSIRLITNPSVGVRGIVGTYPGGLQTRECELQRRVQGQSLLAEYHIPRHKVVRQPCAVGPDQRPGYKISKRVATEAAYRALMDRSPVLKCEVRVTAPSKVRNSIFVCQRAMQSVENGKEQRSQHQHNKKEKPEGVEL